MEELRKQIIALLVAYCKDVEAAKFVSFEKLVDGLLQNVESSQTEDSSSDKVGGENFKLTMRSLGREANPESVAGYWDICAVRGDEQIVIPFPTKVSKVLYTFFMLHPGQEFTFSKMEKCHEEFKRIALALYTDPRMPHTRVTLQWAEDVARRLSSRYGLADNIGNNKHRSEAFAKAKTAVIKALGTEAGSYVIHGNSREAKRVLRLTAELVEIPEAFRDEVFDRRGGFAA